MKLNVDAFLYEDGPAGHLRQIIHEDILPFPGDSVDYNILLVPKRGQFHVDNAGVFVEVGNVDRDGPVADLFLLDNKKDRGAVGADEEDGLRAYLSFVDEVVLYFLVGGVELLLQHLGIAGLVHQVLLVALPDFQLTVQR